MKKKPTVSIILTCFNEGWLMEKSLREIKKVMKDTKLSYEIIFVDDGSSDDSVQEIQRLIEKFSKNSLRLLTNKENQGRGFSVARGLKEAGGEIVGFIDPDLEIPAFYIPYLLKQVSVGNDVVVGYRRYSGELLGLPRVFASRFYSFLVKKYLSIPLNDTETGLKFFCKKTILPILRKVKDKRWFWDTELMARSYFAGLKIKEVPVTIIKNPQKETTVRLVNDTAIYLKSLYQFSKLLRKERKK